MREQLSSLCEPPRYVKVYRNRPSEPRIPGCVLVVSDELMLIHSFHDFTPDGYAILRAADVREVEDGDNEAYWHSMLQSEGLLGGLGLAPLPDLSDFRRAIESLITHHDCLIVECEHEDEDVEDFYIGRVLWTTDEHLVIRHFDVQGRWDPQPSEVEWAEITQVQFATQYIRVFEKYTREFA